MEMTFRPVTPAERLYVFDQSVQIEGQTGCVGCQEGHFDAMSKQLRTNWRGCLNELKTAEFQEEFSELWEDFFLREKFGGFLKDRETMAQFCRDHPESAFDTNHCEFDFRINSEKFSYLLRLNPRQGVYNLFCYCYRQDWLDRHMRNARRGIRFVTPDYKELFRIPDGDSIRIDRSDGSYFDRPCRYVDDCHLEVGRNLYHICELAEKIERSGSFVIPLRSSLPKKCFSFLDDTGEMILIERGVKGYQRTGLWVHGGYTPQEGAAAFNEMVGTTRAQSAAMKAGAFSDWAAPEADPKNYDEQGQFVKPRQRERER